MIIQFIILQVIVFSAVIFFMKKILSSDTQAAVGRLDGVYKDLLNKQKELNEKIEEAEKEYEAKKEEAVKITEEYKSQANEEMRQKKDELIKQAKAQADEILERAKAAVDELKDKLRREVASEGVDTAGKILKAALSKHTSKAFHDMIIDDFLENGKDFDLSKVGPHIQTVQVRTPYKLTDQHQAKIRSFISGKIDRELAIEEIEDPKVIAGVALQFGSLLLDGSLASTVNDSSDYIKESVRLGSDEGVAGEEK